MRKKKTPNLSDLVSGGLKGSSERAVDLLSEMIETANRNGSFKVSSMDFLYYQIAEVRDALKDSLEGQNPF